ncbi:hypothetical protein GCM10010176_087340 [Nonomuraea spiralis]|nr:hypothetical protein GCM10010176_087340 [Nonomuraea spiralis]
MQQAGIITLADKAYQGAEGPAITPHKGRNKPESQKQANRSHAGLRGPGGTCECPAEELEDPPRATLQSQQGQPPLQGHRRS